MADVDLARCAPSVTPPLLRAVVRAESAGRPFAVGMDAGASAVAQPVSLSEAVETAERLASEGRTFSVGLAQIHVSNVRRYGLSWTQAFDGCTNLTLAQRVLAHFARRAGDAGYDGVQRLRAALRGYNSGNVHAGPSDAYATRVLGYLASEPATAAVSASAVPVPSLHQREPGESPDIFEKDVSPPGF